MVYKGPAPRALAARTKPVSRIESVTDRTIRAVLAHDVAARTTMMPTGPGFRYAANKNSRGSLGSTRNRSVSRIRASSTAPLRYPAARPTIVPKQVAEKAAPRPTVNEVRAEKIRTLKISRPMESVPNGWLKTGFP